ncbi:hypothetical protein H920_14812 [Fukomys damarensis]|uniref:Uncharacterized protein n=1 Tax=Fukomys damarensis TaxID=885580 RepID=A0A091CZC8_FUKDA|nr:hypothetical protein H920_14812 [Fukomys damarensis]
MSALTSERHHHGLQRVAAGSLRFCALKQILNGDECRATLGIYCPARQEAPVPAAASSQGGRQDAEDRLGSLNSHPAALQNFKKPMHGC